jgi:hypothetical protein
MLSYKPSVYLHFGESEQNDSASGSLGRQDFQNAPGFFADE